MMCCGDPYGVAGVCTLPDLAAPCLSALLSQVRSKLRSKALSKLPLRLCPTVLSKLLRSQALSKLRSKAPPTLRLKVLLQPLHEVRLVLSLQMQSLPPGLPNASQDLGHRLWLTCFCAAG